MLCPLNINRFPCFWFSFLWEDNFLGLFLLSSDRFAGNYCSCHPACSLVRKHKTPIYISIIVANPLTQAMKHTGECFHEIGELYDGQPKYDWNPFLTGINEYKCVLSTFPTILGNQKVCLHVDKLSRFCTFLYNVCLQRLCYGHSR